MALTGTRRTQLVGVLFCAFLAVQIAVPALALLRERPARFGWQMFSAMQTEVDFVIVDRSGDERPVEPSDYLGKVRGEIDLAAVLPSHICAAEPKARAVRIVPQDGGAPTTTRCP